MQATIGAPTVCKHTVSGTISPSYKECFSPFPHGTGSLSVTRKYLVLGDGSPGFPQNSTYSVVLGNTLKELYCFHLRDYHPLWLNFPEYSVNNIVFYSSVYQQFNQNVPHNTANTRVAAFNMLDGLDCFPFARRYWENRYCFLFHQVLRYFSSLGYLQYPMNSGKDVTTLLVTGCPIRRSPGIRLFPPIRGLSQVVASFIGFLYQGIHRMPLIT